MLKTSEGVVPVVTPKKNAINIKPGSILPYAPPGIALGSRQIDVADRKGVRSVGDLLSEEELEIREKNFVLNLAVSADLL